ncbi:MULTISPECIES: DUF3021 domain-containing protein [Vagococcus]|uniref:DUF3021 domain-containing protein n=1 Tax=Vagococcus TaxID=2737 RepID=UPI002FC60696
MKKMIQHMGVGISSGTFIGLITSFIISWRVGEGKFYPSTPLFMSKFNTELEALGWSIVLWSVIGIMFSFASLIYKKDNWSILKQASIHFSCTYLGLLLLNVLLNWFEYSLTDMMRYTIIFIGIYVSMVVLSMLKVKLSVNEINKKLNDGRGRDNENNH